MIRKIIFYTGRVQGVGFRYTTTNLAKRFDVAGYVQNLDDGRVRLDVQGSTDQVQGLLDAIDRAMAGKIEAADIREQPADLALGDPIAPEAFKVRY